MARPNKQSAEAGLTRARRDFTHAKALREQLKVAELEGNLVPIDAALKLEEMRSTEFRMAVTHIPGTWALRLVGLHSAPDVQEVLRKMVNELLENLSGMGARIRDKLLQRRRILDNTNRTASLKKRKPRKERKS